MAKHHYKRFFVNFLYLFESTQLININILPLIETSPCPIGTQHIKHFHLLLVDITNIFI